MTLEITFHLKFWFVTIVCGNSKEIIVWEISNSDPFIPYSQLLGYGKVVTSFPINGEDV